jgi:hypothetical protein
MIFPQKTATTCAELLCLRIHSVRIAGLLIGSDILRRINLRSRTVTDRSSSKASGFAHTVEVSVLRRNNGGVSGVPPCMR